ncbi:MAG: hypothetical protein A2284_01105 [Deltaproteobacteria bacterium RIFOXYA12_FULL_61_11]|nr:MAG: hypothetical protein A2284_01105 [Deltaproteobacteria bacterium RIFOXYA12_FULL_61_11]
MHVWVDADACPGPIKDILYRAAARRGVRVTLVANRFLRLPKIAELELRVVPKGLDGADKAILEQVRPGDLVITADIPFAAAAIEAGTLALEPRGLLHTAETIRSRLSVRDFLDTLRGSGIATGGPAMLDSGDRKRFADQLDRLLTAAGNEPG